MVEDGDLLTPYEVLILGSNMISDDDLQHVKLYSNSKIYLCMPWFNIFFLGGCWLLRGLGRDGISWERTKKKKNKGGKENLRSDRLDITQPICSLVFASVPCVAAPPSCERSWRDGGGRGNMGPRHVTLILSDIGLFVAKTFNWSGVVSLIHLDLIAMGYRVFNRIKTHGSYI